MDRTVYPTKKLIKDWFYKLNLILFDNELKYFDEIKIERRRQCYAECIVLAEPEGAMLLSMNYVQNSMRYFIYVLAHEMVHAYQWQKLNRMDHGKTFYAWSKKFEEYNIPLSIKL